jgi:hypothetical protein
MWKFVSADKAQIALSARTNFHIQKCNSQYSPIYRNPSRTIRFFAMVRVHAVSRGEVNEGEVGYYYDPSYDPSHYYDPAYHRTISGIPLQYSTDNQFCARA